MRLGGIIQTKNYKDTLGVIQTLRSLTDFVIVLDDNSDSPISYDHSQIDVLLTQRHKGPFNCQRNRTILHYMAWANQCDWVMHMDDDMMLGQFLNSRVNIENMIGCAVKNKADMISVWLRDLWDSNAFYRSDGRWGTKIFHLFQRVWMGIKAYQLETQTSTGSMLHVMLRAATPM